MTGEVPRLTGKWLRSDVPHTGWRCVNVSDTGCICEMCEVTKIAHAHQMVHPQWPGFLECGCVCAGFMTEDPAVERLREVLYLWKRAVRANATPVERLRRKHWHHYLSGIEHCWSYREGRYDNNHNGAAFHVRVSADGRYHLSHRWWGHVARERVHSAPFASELEAALAGIEHAELLLSDWRWFASACEEHVEDIVARRAGEAAFIARGAITMTRREGHEDIARAVESGGMSGDDALRELHRRQRAARGAA